MPRQQTYDPAMPVEWIQPHPDNPNEGDQKALEESIDELGFYGAILVRQLDEFEYQILGGEHRWTDTKARGEETIPVLILHDVDDNEALKILLGDNEITRRGSYNHPKLKKILTALPDIRGTGFPADIMAQLEEHEDKRAATVDANRKDAVFEREYGIVIECPDEETQEKVYNQLLEIGIDPNTLRAVSI